MALGRSGGEGEENYGEDLALCPRGEEQLCLSEFGLLSCWKQPTYQFFSYSEIRTPVNEGSCASYFFDAQMLLGDLALV